MIMMQTDRQTRSTAMEGRPHKQPTSGKSSSVVKPVPLYYYVDQFERLYQQSPLAKMFRQGITQSPTPKGLVPQNNRSRNSTAAKSFKLPLTSMTTSADDSHNEDSHRKPEESIELNVKAGNETESETGECVLMRKSVDIFNTSGASESDRVITRSLALASTLDRMGISEGKKSLTSPQPRPQGLARRNKDVRNRKTPNLHCLIQRLASPVKGGVSPTSKMPKRCVRDEQRIESYDQGLSTEMHSRKGARNQSREGISESAPRNVNRDTVYKGQDHPEVDSPGSGLAAHSCVTKRTSQAKSTSQLDPDPVSIMSPKDTPITGTSASNRKRRPHDLHFAANQDNADQSVSIHPNNESMKSNSSDDVTPKATSIPVFDFSPSASPESQEVTLPDETPVNRRPGGRKTRSNGSKVDVGELIRSLQAGQQPGLETPRSEIPYRGTVDENIRGDDKNVHLSDSSTIDAGEEAVEEEDENDNKEEESILDVEMLTCEYKATDAETADTDSNVMDNEAKLPRDKQTEERTNKQSVRNEQDDELPDGISTFNETTKVPKMSSETIINRWIIKPAPSTKGVCVEGHRIGDKGDQFWHSTAIMVRTNNRLLATKSGSLYRLAGKMDLALSMEQGFSESLVRSFQKGFPSNWRELLYDYYSTEEKRKMKEKPRKSRSTKEQFASPMTNHVDHAVTDSVRKGKKKKNSFDVTPQNLRVKDLQRSSSGRLIKPPLAYWTGQRIRHNTSLDVVEILPGTEDCTSSSAYQINLQDSLELGPREKRAFRRTAMSGKLRDSTSGRKHKHQVREEDSGRDEDSSSCLDLDTATEKVDVENTKGNRRVSKRNKYCHTEAAVLRKTRLQSKSTVSSNITVIHGSKEPGFNIDDNDPQALKLGGKSRYQRRKMRNEKLEEQRIERVTTGSYSSDHPDVISNDLVTDDSVSTSSSVADSKNKEIYKDGERAMMHMSSQQSKRKQPPPPPQKVRSKKDVGRTFTVHQSRAPVSPLYYQLNHASEEEGSCKAQHLNVGKTPMVVLNKYSGASCTTVGQFSSDPGQNSGSSVTEMINSEQDGKRFSEKDSSRESAGTLNLREEILAVVEKHKQGRIARMRERSIKHTLYSKDKTRVRNSSSTSDVYDLSEDEARPSPMRIPYLPPGAAATTGESVSNWSEEGDKSINQTWVTRNKPNRRVYGALEDLHYRSEETSTETTSTMGNEVGVAPLSSDKETTLTENSDDVFKLHMKSPKKSLSTRLKGKRTRHAPEPDLDQTSEDEQTQYNQKPVTARGSKRTTIKVAIVTASSEDTDDSTRPNDEPVRRGRSKKVIVIQRHQPMRNCKSGNDYFETNDALRTLQNHGNERRTLRDSSERGQLSTAPIHEFREEKATTRKQQVDVGMTPNVAPQGGRRRNSRGLEVVERQIMGTSRRIENGDTDFRTRNEGVAHIQSATKSSPRKATKQQAKELENQAQISVALTATVGTMKRKRQLRDLVQQHNRGYEDDIFDSTPFKKQKKLKIPLGEWDTEEDSQDSQAGQAGKTPGSARFKTPNIRYQGVLPLSDKKTPYSNLISPGLLPSVDRKHIDQYIHGLQKKKKGHGLAQRPHAAKKSTSVSRGMANSGSATLTQVMDMFDVTPVSDSDPDEDRDYYWSDEEH